MTTIGQTLVLKGTLSAAEDIRIAGRVEGAVRGDIVAGESVALQDTASVAGKIAAPRIAIFEGADFNGRVETSAPRN